MGNKDWIAFIVLFFIVASASIFVTAYSIYNKKNNQQISKEIEDNRKNQPVEFINKQLDKKVDSCILYKTSYGWKCVDKDGKAYKIYHQPSKVYNIDEQVEIKIKN